MTALILANKNADAKGKLPPSTCKQDNATMVTCTAPAAGISGVVFQTYPSLKALYATYTAKVSSVNSGKFRQDFSDCGSQSTYGEVGWNHLFQHTRKYTVDQMAMSKVRDDQAAGRVFCNFTGGLEYMVWTQNDGHLMGYVAGPVHRDVWNWWVAVHHNIGIGSVGQVTIAPDAAQNANASSVAAFLDRYFTAINTHDYQSYISLLSPQFRQGLTAKQFRSGYKSATESAETLVNITTGANGDLVAAMAFTSHQDPADSVDGKQSCTNWNISLFLERGSGGYLIDQPPPGYHASYSACP